jgi:hypothetical protein
MVDQLFRAQSKVEQSSNRKSLDGEVKQNSVRSRSAGHIFRVLLIKKKKIEILSPVDFLSIFSGEAY